MAPLLDMVFILLIFFVVTTTFVTETGLLIKKPRAESAGVLPEDSIRIAIAADGTIMHAGRRYTMPAIKRYLVKRLAFSSRPVILIPDVNSSSGILVKIMDACKMAGARSVSIAARPEDS